jgi:hypothetical protein
MTPQVDSVTIPNLLAQLYQTPHPEIKLIEVEQSGSVIVIYGNKETSQKKPGRLILKWNLENNQCRDDLPQQQQSRPPHQQQPEQILVSPKKKIRNRGGGGGGGMGIGNK